MLSSIKKLFGIKDKAVHEFPAPSWPARPLPPMRPKSGFTPSPLTREPATVTTPAPARSQSTTAISLVAIVEKLPANLRRLLGEIAAEGIQANIPTALIQSQIASGVVRLTFGELRQYVPPGFFVAGKNLDPEVVELPLHEILAKIDPSLLPRRSGQRQTVVPVEIPGPFANEEQLRAVRIAQKPAAPAPAFQGGRDGFAEVFNTNRIETPTAPGHVSMPQPKAEELFIRKIPAPAPAPETDVFQPVFQPLNDYRPAFQPPAPLEEIAPTVETPAAPQDLLPRPQPERIRVQFRPPAAAVPAPSITPAPVASPAPATEDKACITVALSELCQGWPESLKQEIAAHHLFHSSISLPMSVVEVGMKQGTVALPWRIIRSWLKPTSLIPQSVHDSVVVELPLRVITPIFLAALKRTKPQIKVEVDPEIPNVFSHKGHAEPIAPSAAPEPIVLPIPAPAQAPAPTTVQLLQAVQPTATRSSTGTSYFNVAGAEEEIKPPALRPNGTPGTEFLKKHASPAEIVKKASSLPNVEGVLITLPDGLLIAGKVPPTINAEAMAGFVPQIYGRVMQCSKELRMGELNNLSFTVGQVPWRIFKVSAIYFAAFGSMGASLPTADLAQLASELNRNPS